MAMVEQAFYFPSKMIDLRHAVPLEREVETVAVPHYLEIYVANPDTVEIRVQKIVLILATLRMDLVVMPSVVVVKLIPETVDSCVWPVWMAMTMNVDAVGRWLTVADPMSYHKTVYASIMMLWY